MEDFLYHHIFQDFLIKSHFVSIYFKLIVSLVVLFISVLASIFVFKNSNKDLAIDSISDEWIYTLKEYLLVEKYNRELLKFFKKAGIEEQKYISDRIRTQKPQTQRDIIRKLQYQRDLATRFGKGDQLFEELDKNTSFAKCLSLVRILEVIKTLFRRRFN